MKLFKNLFSRKQQSPFPELAHTPPQITGDGIVKQHIVIGVPTLGTVSTDWAMSYGNLQAPMNIAKAPLFVLDAVGRNIGKNEVAETRNKIVWAALSTETKTKKCHSIFWWDDDVLLCSLALVKLFNFDRDIVSGVYFTKRPDGLSNPLIYPGPSQGYDKFVPDVVKETWGFGMGCCLVKIGVYRRMLDAGLPKDRYGNPAWYVTTERDPAKMHGSIADSTLDCGASEDLNFLQLAQELGYKPLVDCGKYAFGFHQDRATLQAYPEKQWRQLQTRQPITWETENGIVAWK